MDVGQQNIPNSRPLHGLGTRVDDDDGTEHGCELRWWQPMNREAEHGYCAGDFCVNIKGCVWRVLVLGLKH